MAIELNSLQQGIQSMLSDITNRQINKIASDIKVQAASRKAAGRIDSRNPETQGVRILFSDASSTGKTLAASRLATKIGLPLYRVDLGALVSKYIGETEKNLNEVFAKAERERLVLFFDEADALFGKRTDVKDSNDQYANLETSYLLERLDNYSGIVIIASNLHDSSFIRRFEFVVEVDTDEENTKSTDVKKTKELKSKSSIERPHRLRQLS
jgi:SpoVK/Ycf46/Vps4 family AAA+-type ATPase